MRILLMATIAAVSLTGIWGCEEVDEGPLKPELRTESVCAGGVGEYDVFVERKISEIGPAGNDLAFADEAVWVVESSANTVSRFERAEDQMEHGFVDVGNERNPYALAVDEDGSEIWVANYALNTVSVVDMATGEIIIEIEDDAFAEPSAVALTKDFAYVANVDFRGLNEGYGPGSIGVIDRSNREVVGILETEFQNPHFLAIYEIDSEPLLFVSGSGVMGRSQNQVRVESEGGLIVFDIGVDPVSPPAQNYPLGQADIETVGAPGRPLLEPTGGRLYFASGIAPVLFVFDLQAREWIYDAAAPLELYEADGDATHRGAMGPDGLLWITAFNDDALYLIDTACDEAVAPAIDLGEVADMLEGPQAVVVTDEGTTMEGYYLRTIANALGRLRLEPTGEEL